jgi:hypothetical protein
MLLGDHSEVDLDDMFGVRGALEDLPVGHHSEFLERWGALTEDAPGDLPAIHAAVTREAAVRTVQDGAAGPVANAWRQVSQAMTRYLAWTADRSS